MASKSGDVRNLEKEKCLLKKPEPGAKLGHSNCLYLIGQYDQMEACHFPSHRFGNAISVQSILCFLHTWHVAESYLSCEGTTKF